jgi:periplasmic protein TonB
LIAAEANMRLTFSLLTAMLCHGILFGIGAVVLSHRPSERVAVPQPVEIEVVAAKPDPIAQAAPPSATTVDRTPSTSILRRSRTLRRPPQVAIASQAAADVRPVVADVAAPASPPVGVANAPAAAGPSSATSSRRPIDGAGVGTGAVLTAKPRYRTNPIPEYPIASRRRREEGVVLLNVAVDVSGTPTTISLNHSSGYPLLDRAALDAVRRWTFEPARSGGVAMFSLVVVPVRFSLEDRRW